MCNKYNAFYIIYSNIIYSSIIYSNIIYSNIIYSNIIYSNIIYSALMQDLKKNIYHRINLLKSLRTTLAKLQNTEILTEITVQEKILTSKDLVLKKKYFAIYRDVQSKLQDPNEILTLENEEREVVCPLTKMKIVDRYESGCGHVFERKAVEKMFKQNRNAKCPVQGCDKRLIAK